MKRLLIRLSTFLFVLLAYTYSWVPYSSASPLPPPPTYYVYDETKTLSDSVLRGLQTLLVEHDRLTDEQFMIGVFNVIEKDGFNATKSQIFEHWKIGRRESKNNGVLLLVAQNLKKAQFEVGLSLDSVFPLERREEIVSDFVNPNLKNSKLGPALALGVYHSLEALNSPLILSGQADEILKAMGVNPNQTSSMENFSWGWTLFLFLLGIVTLGIMLYEILSREAHFTSSGWIRVRPFHGYITKIQIIILKKKKIDTKNERQGGISGSW